MESMQHMHYQYAGQYWLTQALRNASGVLTDNIDEACLVWVDTYCYQQVLCTNLPVKVSKSYSEVQLEMRKSVFCLLPPGDTASSNRLTETILSGCIPVFIGPPWHEMPFHRGEVDWASMAVFLNITEASWLESPDCQFKQQKWYQSADVGFATVSVPDLPAAYEYLRTMPKDALERHQAALQRERPKFFYGTAPGRQFSALADVVFGNLIAYGLRLKAGEYTA
ncbi:hypothetical protein CHLNCDRAFT_139109 [Chlorella variabilis]|uniref:Exostosin GT47 domain-containing protein n=1 Tax=Chlorella variabilis TaxID=554065 RepID=E1ZPD9_CHLVA|nr:hypothetical protein CHLNCDRAFT_139108 [Chlorella variabilis]XP_005844339.1 hypothetical protein CHLNCDRAFT_139109 [Chlorella variabilis]EFN52236.1 hypothetical protein CHLNCDRAFT_139108 [Chlorella variabilis]EFN52237.1 hypothetical protein CHLNCDRAFT_139109 [Chlorella variabilis]|eukprot:XP_005844338.1 hypothetical protein CHLNCDRAFT_139108 [Chlorella variabilis]